MKAAGSTRLALVVEDEWLIRIEIADALDAAGWQVLEAGSGEEAIALLLPEAMLNLLVTDIRLGGPLSGWDVADHYRLAMPAISVIYASANPAIEERQVPGSVFMSKPSKIPELVAVSERLWRNASQTE